TTTRRAAMRRKFRPRKILRPREPPRSRHSRRRRQLRQTYNDHDKFTPTMKDRPRVQDFDWTLLAIVGAISAIGLLEIYSSTHASAMNGMQWKQLMWIGIGLAGMFLIS